MYNNVHTLRNERGDARPFISKCQGHEPRIAVSMLSQRLCHGPWAMGQGPKEFDVYTIKNLVYERAAKGSKV